MIVDSLELLVDPQGLTEPFQSQYEQMVVYDQEYTNLIAELSMEDRQVYASTLENFSVRVEEIRLSLVKAMGDLSENQTSNKLTFGDIVETTDWDKVPHDDFLNFCDVADVCMEVEIIHSKNVADEHVDVRK